MSEDLEPDKLRALVQGTAGATGEGFFRSLVQHLAAAMGYRHAFIAEMAAPGRVRTIAFWLKDAIVDDVEWDLDGTPCEAVAAGEIRHYPEGVSRLFPRDEPLVEMGIESYLGIPLKDEQGGVLGHLAVFDERPMPHDPRHEFVGAIFAARATAELLRLRAEKLLRHSEERFRDLFEEAPIAYVHEGLDTKFITANKAALRAFCLPAEEVPHTYGHSFIVDNPDNQRRLREAFESVGRGVDTSGVTLELRRRDGRPLWIEWWSRPDPGGQYTRTMFVDITERVLMEQEQSRLQAQNLYLREELKSVHNFDEIVGRSPALLEVLGAVSDVAPTDATVLVLGETGTGKELLARAVHSRSKRKDQPLVKVNCGAIPEGLVESELFGHVRGAFTGALQARVGRFELANGGTIFLDELGELPLDTQVKLLRVLQEQEFSPVGSSKTIGVDVRVIAASNRDLEDAVRQGRFRADLLYRLNVFPIRVPPLRERREDIPLLITFCLQGLAKKLGKPLERFTPESLERLVHYPWPGNIRELQNVVERAAILARTPVLELGPEVLRDGHAAPAAGSEAPQTLERVEHDHIVEALAKSDGVIEGPRGAASLLGLNPNTLRSRMKKLGIEKPQRRGAAPSES